MEKFKLPKHLLIGRRTKARYLAILRNVSSFFYFLIKKPPVFPASEVLSRREEKRREYNIREYIQGVPYLNELHLYFL